MANTRTDTVVPWLTAATAARVSGLSLDMVNYLCRHEIVAPRGEGRRGRGRQRRYTYGDVLLLRVVAKLLANGLSVLRLKSSFAALRKRGNSADILVRKYVMTDGKDVYFAEKSGAAELLQTGQMSFAFVLELGQLRDDVSRELSRVSKLAAGSRL